MFLLTNIASKHRHIQTFLRTD